MSDTPEFRPERCLCGCGKRLVQRENAKPRIWFNEACRKRAKRRENSIERARARPQPPPPPAPPPPYVPESPLDGSGSDARIPASAEGKLPPMPSAATNAGRALRDLLLLEMQAAGASFAEMCAADGRPAHVVRERLIELEAEGRRDAGAALLRADPVDVVEGVLRRTLFTWNLLARTAGESQSDSARVSALKGMLDADARSVSLLQSLGRLPRELGTLRHVVEVRSAARELLQAVNALERGEMSTAEVKGVLMRYAGEDGGAKPFGGDADASAEEEPPGDAEETQAA